MHQCLNERLVRPGRLDIAVVRREYDASKAMPRKAYTCHDHGRPRMYVFHYGWAIIIIWSSNP